MQIEFSSLGRVVIITPQSEVSIFDFQNVSMIKEIADSSATFEGYRKFVHNFLKLAK